MIKTLLAATTICAALMLPASAIAADADVFSGIYSITDPVTGAEVDVMKIRKFGKTYGVFTYLGRTEGREGPLAAAEDNGPRSMPAAFPLDPGVRTLSVPDEGYLYYAPNGAYSPVGRSDTAYMSQLTSLGMYALKRRPLPEGRERSATGKHEYQPGEDEREVPVSTLNYSSRAIQVSVGSASNGKNVVDTDPLNAYMAGATNCCFSLPEKWDASLRVQIAYRTLADGTLKIVPVAVPRYDSPQQFDVVVGADDRIDIVFNRPPGKPLPQPPAALRRAAIDAELSRRKQFLQDLVKQQPKMDEQVQQAFANEIKERKYRGRYLEVFSACKLAFGACDSEATRQAELVK